MNDGGSKGGLTVVDGGVSDSIHVQLGPQLLLLLLEHRGPWSMEWMEALSSMQPPVSPALIETEATRRSGSALTVWTCDCVASKAMHPSPFQLPWSIAIFADIHR